MVLRVRGEHSLENLAPYITCKLTQITGSPLLSPILGATSSTLDFQDIMSRGNICLINLAKGEVGGKDASFAGGLLTTKLAMAAQARARIPQNMRKPINVYMDEFQTYSSSLLGDMMSEVRKYGLRMILANQTLSQIDGSGFHGDAAGGILGNVANIISFRIGIRDASVLEKWTGPQFGEQDLAYLDDHHAIARILANGQPLQPMKIATMKPRQAPLEKDAAKKTQAQRAGVKKSGAKKNAGRKSASKAIGRTGPARSRTPAGKSGSTRKKTEKQ
jgi:hypothetical protein